MAIVILTTGVGGGFAKVLVASGVGAAVSGALGSTGLPLLALAYLLALLLRVAQGPTAVAIIAAAGIVSPALAQAHLDGAERLRQRVRLRLPRAALALRLTGYAGSTATGVRRRGKATTGRRRAAGGGG